MRAVKAPAMSALPRAQCDKKAYQFRAKAVLERQPHLDLKQGNAVPDIFVDDNGRCRAAWRPISASA